MKMKTVLLAFLLTFTTAYAKTITDDYGRVIDVPETITKIYAASPQLTMSLLAFDSKYIAALNMPFTEAQKPFVGLAYDKPVVGGFFGQGQTLNFEVLASTKPDVILMWGKMSGAEKILDKLQKLGIPVLLVRNDKIYDLITQFELFAKLTGDTKRADELIRYTQETLQLIDSLQEKLAKQKSVLYYFAEGVDGLNSECDGSFHLEPFTFAGAKNALNCKMSSNFGMESIDIESIIISDPDVIVAMEPLFAKEITNNLRFMNLRAVKQNKVYPVPSTPFNYISRPPSFMRLIGIRWLINSFYPLLLEKSFEKEKEEFERLFFPQLKES